MADARLFFSNALYPKTIDSLAVTAWESETHNRTNNITSYPVEEGADISDHIQNLPIELTVSGIIEALEYGGNILEAFTVLEDLMRNKQLIAIVTGLKVYENMAISDLSFPRTALNGGSLSFTATLIQMRTISSQAIIIPNTILADNDVQSQATQDIGKTTSGQTQQQEDDSFSFIEQVDAQLDDIFGVIQ